MTAGNTGAPEPTNFRLAAVLLGVWGFYQIAVGLYFILLRPSFLPEDLRAAESTVDAMRSAAPGLTAWLQWVFAVLGGQMAAAGILVMGGALSITQGRRVGRTDMATYAAAGALSVGLMALANFALGSDFRWLLVAPVLLWLTALVVLGREASLMSTRERQGI